MARPYAQTKYIGKQHHHGCTRCHRRYTCACTDTNNPKLCNVCTSGIPSKNLAAAEPVACCTKDNVRPASRDDRERYALAGQEPWVLCRTCKRQFPCNPEQVGRS